jgi:hypothetical protein
MTDVRRLRPPCSWRWPCCVALAALSIASAVPQAGRPAATNQPPVSSEQPAQAPGPETVPPHVEPPDVATQLDELRRSVTRITLATALASVLALRPRRRGTPRRQPHLIQTQIIIAAVGATVMIIVGSSVARAFAVFGAAGLVRYRSQISDPKDGWTEVEYKDLMSGRYGVDREPVFAAAECDSSSTRGF